MKYMLKEYKELEKQGIEQQGGITTNTNVEGDGYNSDNYNYQFFNVDDYIVGTQCILSLALRVTTNPGIAKTFQSGYATLINKKNILKLNLFKLEVYLS